MDINAHHRSQYTKEFETILDRVETEISKKADPVYLKGSYAKIFNAVVAEPCQQTGTYKLSFIIGDGESKNLVASGGQGSVT